MRFSTFLIFLLSLATIGALHDGAYLSAGCFIAGGAVVAALCGLFRRDETRFGRQP